MRNKIVVAPMLEAKTKIAAFNSGPYPLSGKTVAGLKTTCDCKTKKAQETLISRLASIGVISIGVALNTF